MGMTPRSAVRRLRAWHVGAPIGLGQTIHTALAEPENRMVLAFLKMGGETRPWAVAWRLPGKKAQFRFVPEPRFRASVDDMMAELGPVLAGHLRHPDVDPAPSGPDLVGPDDLRPLRQVWLPNGSHVDMLHHLAYAYARRPKERSDAEDLRLLGRTSLFAFLESRRPGQQIVMSASDVLRSAYDFPAEDVRQAHLGFLLAWLDHRGRRDEGLAAALEAEREPVSTSLLPELERKDLGKVVQAYNDARRAGRSKEMAKHEKAIGTILRPELERRLHLVERAIGVVEGDPRPVNAGVEELVTHSLKAQYWQYVREEVRAAEQGKEPWVDSPETDFQAGSAAGRFYRYDASADRMFAVLVHDDRELEAEAIATGRAFRGTITAVWDDNPGKKTQPVWIIEDPTPGPLSLRHGDRVCVVGHKQREAFIRRIETTKGGGLEIEVEITGHKTEQAGKGWPNSMHGADELWLGHAVTIIGTSFADMTDKKAFKARTRDPRAGDWILGRATDDRSAGVYDGAFVEVPE